MKIFKFNYKKSVVLYLLIVATLLLGVVSLYFNIFGIIENLQKIGFLISWGFITIRIIFTALCLFLIAYAISLFFSCYKITEEFLTFKIGFFGAKYRLRDIIAINHFNNTDKLVVYFTDQTFTVIIIDSIQYNNFVEALRGFNEKILFNEQSDK